MLHLLLGAPWFFFRRVEVIPKLQWRYDDCVFCPLAHHNPYRYSSWVPIPDEPAAQALLLVDSTDSHRPIFLEIERGGVIWTQSVPNAIAALDYIRPFLPRRRGLWRLCATLYHVLRCVPGIPSACLRVLRAKLSLAWKPRLTKSPTAEDIAAAKIQARFRERQAHVEVHVAKEDLPSELQELLRWRANLSRLQQKQLDQLKAEDDRISCHSRVRVDGEDFIFTVECVGRRPWVRHLRGCSRRRLRRAGRLWQRRDDLVKQGIARLTLAKRD